jgi:hypothetical protein
MLKWVVRLLRGDKAEVTCDNLREALNVVNQYPKGAEPTVMRKPVKEKKQ